MKNLFDIRGRVVVVTGGAGILGRSICAYLAGQGARVAVLDRDEKAGEALVGEIRAAGGDALFFATDVLNREVLVSNRPTSRSSTWRSKLSARSWTSICSARCCPRRSSARP